MIGTAWSAARIFALRTGIRLLHGEGVVDGDLAELCFEIGDQRAIAFRLVIAARRGGFRKIPAR